MNNDYTWMVQRVMDHITQLDYSAATQSVYRRCFNRFGNYLSGKATDYSPEETKVWLSSGDVSKANFNIFTAAINKLNDLFLYGEIHDFHYSPAKTIPGKLCPKFQHLLNEIKDSLSDKADDTVRAHSWEIASILLSFQNQGICSIVDIRYEHLLDTFFGSMNRSYYSRCGFHQNLRLLLQFSYDKGLVPFGFTLFVDAMISRNGYYWNSVSKEQIEELKSLQPDTALSMDAYLEIRNTVYQEHCQQNYSVTAKNGVRRITNLFYLFMDMNDLRYYPRVSDVWLGSLKQTLDGVEYKHVRRILSLLEKQFGHVSFSLNSSFSFRETMYKRLPDWCRPQVDSFLEMKKNEGWAASTLNMYRSSVCRFCFGIHELGIRSFHSLDAKIIKQFNLNDTHRTPEGKNAYNSRIRYFLEYLGETHSTDNPFLFLSLPSICAARETLVVTLTEEEQETLRKIFQKDDATVSLREKAMIQLGLYMGIRGIDIVNLTIDNVDWERASIRVLQEKTGYEVNLPMPAHVANAVYRYIMKERPDSSDRSIFIREKAPFNRIGKGACLRALGNALPDRKVAGSGFHVTRKTYATNLLKNDVSAQNVAETLGHHGLGSVHKYLSLEEEGMRQCCLSLSDKGLLLEGGFCHE